MPDWSTWPGSGLERVRCSSLALGWGMSMFQLDFRPERVAWFQFSFGLWRRWGHVGGFLVFLPNLIESLLSVLSCVFIPRHSRTPYRQNSKNRLPFFETFLIVFTLSQKTERLPFFDAFSRNYEIAHCSWHPVPRGKHRPTINAINKAHAHVFAISQSLKIHILDM